MQFQRSDYSNLYFVISDITLLLHVRTAGRGLWTVTVASRGHSPEVKGESRGCHGITKRFETRCVW